MLTEIHEIYLARGKNFSLNVKEKKSSGQGDGSGSVT